MRQITTSAVVICAHTMDRIENLRAAIRSLFAQTRPADEIIIVVDHNSELQRSIVAEFPSVTTLANAGAKGLSGARNTGIGAAHTDVIVFLDDDAVAEPDWLNQMMAAYVEPDVLAVGGHIEPDWPGARPGWFPAEFLWVVGCSYRGLPTVRMPVRNLIGCNMSVRSDVLDSVGGFREDLGRNGDNGSGCEETELFIRVRSAFPNRKVIYDPGARVRHSVASARTRWRYFATRCRAEGRSKSRMVRTVGPEDGLSSERAYTLQTLPSGIWRGVAGIGRGDFDGARRAAAIAAGFGLVAGSFILERFRWRFRAPAPEEFRPTLIADIELTEPLPVLPNRHPDTGVKYQNAFCLIRSSGHPVDLIEVPFAEAGADSVPLAGLVDRAAAHSALAPVSALVPRPATERDTPTVTVIVATRDRPGSLSRCLDSLMDQSWRDFDVVVVDNSPSTNETARLVEDVYAPTGRVRYVREDVAGLGRAHNAGFAIAAGDVVAFTDDDVIVDRGWVAAIAENFAHDERIGCVTGLILPAELETRAQVWTERHGGFGKGLVRKAYDLHENRPDNPLFPYAAGMFGSGANMAFLRSALDRIGGFDPALGAGTRAKGGDDLAAFLAVVQAGYRLIYEPRALVWHHHRRAEEGMVGQAYGYGVGLGAYLTKQIVEHPRLALLFARRLPAAAFHLFGRTSDKLARLPSDYPRGLVWRERFGILMGVPAYIRSRRISRAGLRPGQAPHALSSEAES